MFYDPMICKLVTHGETRAEALDRMRASLDAYVISGVGHNIPFLRALTEHPRFISGAISTQFIGEEYPRGFGGVVLGGDDLVELAAGAALLHALREESFSETEPQWRIEDVVVTLGETEGEAKGPAFTVRLSWNTGLNKGRRDWTARVTAAGAEKPIFVVLNNVQASAEDPMLFAERSRYAVDENRPSTRMFRLQCLARLPAGFSLVFKGANVAATVRSARAHELGGHMRAKAKKDMSRALQSPMPGKLVSLAVKAGDAVEVGQELAVVEAMKMANVLRSPRKGVVRAVSGKAGDTLAVDQVILEFE